MLDEQESRPTTGAASRSADEATVTSVEHPADELPDHLPRDAEGLNELARRLDVRKLDLLVLGKEVDPFNTGTAGKVTWAEWFAEIWQRFGFTGGVHPRRVHYRAMTSGDVIMPTGEVYLNTYEHWRKMSPASNHARDLGLVDPALFVDRRNPAVEIHAFPRTEEPVPAWDVTLHGAPLDTFGMPWTLPESGGWSRPWFNASDLRPLELPWSGIDPADVGRTSVSGYDYDPFDQPYYEALWIEKSTMDDVLDPLCRRLGVDYSPGKGFTSKIRVVELLQRAAVHGKPLRVFTISDYDPGGSHMATAISRTLEYFGDIYAPGIEIVVRHLGMHRDWVGKYNLPRAPIEPGKSAIAQGRIDNFEALHGEGAVELDALEALHPGALGDEIRSIITGYRDADLRDNLAAAEDAAKTHVSGVWQDLTASVRSELGQECTEIGALAEQYRERLGEVQSRRDEVMAPFVERLRELEAEAVEALETIREEHTAIVEEYEAEVDPYRQRLDQLWDEVRELADSDVDLPDRPEPVVEVDESGVLFDSRRHWWEQLHRYREEQGRGSVFRNTHTRQSRSEHNLTCEGCGKEFTARRRDARACGNTCRKRLQYRQKNGGTS